MCSVMISIVAYGDGIGTRTYVLLSGVIVLGMEITRTAIEGVSFCSETGVINTTELFFPITIIFFTNPVVTSNLSFFFLFFFCIY